ncbi:hypothetical protein ADL19_14920 [Streptomyces purpurogeneiscleroticus]|nr:hypothetical protein ADL19_14920 [Streptomyces purpurogeneiscleroticus]
MADPAAAYCGLARVAIQAARSQGELRQWWRAETVRRSQYRLTDEQTKDLAVLASERVSELARMQLEGS